MSKQTKVYLGDGVYSAFDGYNVVLTTEDGMSITNTIFMEPEVIESFIDFVKQAYRRGEERVKS